MYRDQGYKYPVTEFPMIKSGGYRVRALGFCLCLFVCLFVCFWPHHEAYGILVPQLGIEPVPPAVEARSLNHWTAREARSTWV